MAGRSRLFPVSGVPGVASVEPERRSGAQVLLAALPFFIMAVVAVVDILVGPGVGFLPLLSLGPALAAVSRRPAQTALIGALSLVLCVLLAIYDDLAGSRRGIIALVTIAGVTVTGVVASAGRHRRERELADVKAVAEVAQRVVLRQVPREVSPIHVAVRYISAAASARIGGDLYEVIPAREGVRLIVGDVQGKGLAAVQTAAAVLGAFREAAYDAPDLGEIAARIELSLQRQAAEEEFVTAVLAQITASGSKIEILNCGHPPPLLLPRDSAPRLVEPAEASLPLGLAQLAATSRELTTVSFGPGDQLLFYTDGISEARDKAGDFYPVGRCGALFGGREPDDALDQLRDDVIRHVGHALLDDAAMLLISRHPAGQQAAAGQDRAAAKLLLSAPREMGERTRAAALAQPGTSDDDASSRGATTECARVINSSAQVRWRRATGEAMEQADSVIRVPPGDRVVGDPTPGMVREQAVAVDGLWSGLVSTEAHMISGWHHHGDHDTSVYVIDGALRMESGPGGATVVDAGPGDFVYVPKRVIHRESNPGDTAAHAVVTRAGHGPVTVNVGGPAPATDGT
jgi:serine phosphatase RsbU (regulator of sigma subunit)/uncharacterized RmlC-like cupin family protein